MIMNSKLACLYNARENCSIKGMNSCRLRVLSSVVTRIRSRMDEVDGAVWRLQAEL